MKKQTGIWIDTKKAVIVFLEGNNLAVRIINSARESGVRVTCQVKWFTRFANQCLNLKRKKRTGVLMKYATISKK